MLKALLTGLASLALAACGRGHADTDLTALAAVDNGALLVDVRSPGEFAGGHLEGALNIPHTEILAGIRALGTDREAPIVLYCRSGNRSGIATRALEEAGFTDVTNAGAYTALASARGIKD